MDNERLETLLKDLMTDTSSKDKKAAMLTELEKTALFVPVNFPKDADISKLKNVQQSGPMKLPQDCTPLPIVIKSKDGKVFLPVVSTKEQIPKDLKPQAVLQTPLVTVASIALQENSNISGVALNPFRENVMLKEPYLKLVVERAKVKRAGIKVTPEQAQVLLRRKVETELVPKALYENPKEFTEKLCEEFADHSCEQGTDYLVSFYRRVYHEKMPSLYKAEQFSLMPLNIREDLLLIRIDYPDTKKQEPVILRGYVLYNEQAQIADYYAVEKGLEKGKNKAIRVGENLKCEYLGESVEEGSELQMVLDFYDEKYESK